MSNHDHSNVIAYTEVHYLHSAIVDDEYKLFVARSQLPTPPEQQLPVLYVLDANGTFGSVVEIARMLQLGGEMPACYVVGIGYRMGAFMETMPKRSRDYTPTRFARFETGYPMLSGMPGSVTTGGAPSFLRFIEMELKPWVAANLPSADTSDATLIGMSAGGACAIYALLQETHLFQRYLACSPALLWDDDALIRIEERSAGLRRDLHARLFLACGSLENKTALAEAEAAMPMPMRDAHAMVWQGMRMLEPLQAFSASLLARSYPGLKLDLQVFDEENHTSVFPAAVSRGLRFLFKQ